MRSLRRRLALAWQVIHDQAGQADPDVWPDVDALVFSGAAVPAVVDRLRLAWARRQLAQFVPAELAALATEAEALAAVDQLRALTRMGTGPDARAELLDQLEALHSRLEGRKYESND